MDIFNTKKKTATIMLCSGCNTNCKHCYISYSGNRKLQDVKEMISNLQQQGYDVILNGSEPLIFPDFIQLFKLTGQHQIFTNGKVILNKPELLKQLKEYGINQISFSYHYGVQEEWSDISLKEVEQAIALAKQENLKVCLLCSLCSKNYEKVMEICEKAVDLNVNEVHFTNFIVQGNAIKNNFKSYIINEQQILKALTDINNARKIYDKSVLKISRCGSFGNIINSKNFCCDAGIDDFVITPDNNIYPCLFFAGIEKYKIGEYKNKKMLLTKKCEFDCNDCYVKNILNYNKNIEIVYPID